MMFYFVTVTLRKKHARAYTPYEPVSWTITADDLVAARQKTLDKITAGGHEYGMLFIERSDQVTSWVEHTKHAQDFEARTIGKHPRQKETL